MALILDVETIGLPNTNGLPYGHLPHFTNVKDYDTARIVQFSMMICDEHFKEIELKDFIVKTEGFTIENHRFHGITNEMSKNEGIPFSHIAEVFLTHLKQVSHVVAHNANFDINVIKSELYRSGLHSIISELDTKQILCTMKHTKTIVNIRRGRYIKDPTLDELYMHVFQTQMKHAHNSKYDVINLHRAIERMHNNNTLKFRESLVYHPTTQSDVESKTEKVQENTEDNKEDKEENKENKENKEKENKEDKENKEKENKEDKENKEKENKEDYSKLSVVELRRLCKNKGITGYSKLNKSSIIEKLKLAI